MSEQAPETGSQPKALKTVLFFGALGLVVGAFFLLASLEKPPGLPSDDTHKYTVDEKVKKAAEKRINTTCQSCHGVAGETAADHVCHQMAQCLPKTHPPKSTCIKCHRHGRR
jgi:hypothetical protein